MFFNYVELYKNPVKLLKSIEMWLKKDSTKLQNILLVLFNLFFIGNFTILQTVDLLQAKSLDDVSEIIEFQLTYLAICIKGLNIFFRRQQILSLLKTLEEIKNEPWIKKTSSKNVKHRLDQTSKVYKLIFRATILSCFYGFLDPFLFNGLVYRMWFPFDYENSAIVWWSVNFYQIINCFVYLPLLNVFNMFPIFLIAFAIGFIEELCEKLEEITSVKRKKTQKNAGSSRQLETIYEVEDCNLEELLTCIKFQVKIKAFVSEITECFAKTLWMQGFSSTLILCTTSFALTEVRNDLTC